MEQSKIKKAFDDAVVAISAFVFSVFGVALLVGAFVGLPVMLTVNYVFTDQAKLAIFGVAHISFWKAFWLYVMCGMLFGGSSKKDK